MVPERVHRRKSSEADFVLLLTRWFQPWPSWAKLLGVILWQNKQLDLSYEMNNTNRRKNQHWITASSKDLKESAIYLQQMEQRSSHVHRISPREHRLVEGSPQVQRVLGFDWLRWEHVIQPVHRSTQSEWRFWSNLFFCLNKMKQKY